MDIALIADDTKKELMTQFCIAYCGILSKHHICATSTTGKYVSEATGLEIEKLLCDVHNVPVATNIATAEVLICALDRGDLDWREIVNPRSDYNRRRRGVIG